MAALASSAVAISTNPNPRDRPLSRSVATVPDSTVPKPAKACFRRSGEVENESPPTKSLTAMDGLLREPPTVIATRPARGSGSGSMESRVPREPDVQAPQECTRDPGGPYGEKFQARTQGGPPSADRALEDGGVDPPGQAAPGARATQEPAALHDQRPPQHGHHRPTRDLPALPRAIVGDVEIVASERLLDARIDEGQVGVAPR